MLSKYLFGSVAILSGILSRVAAGGLFVIFLGALIVHLRDGWMVNWFGKRTGKELSIS
jgi:putative oxidoreductase